ncbi:MAG: peptidoglycan editing factor PgeF [Tissierellia bacterium]|nr:peptidoglycan editing factor PgeF [Tissierellia bacterium]
MKPQIISVDNHKFIAYPHLWDMGFFHVFTTGDMDMGFVTTKSYPLLKEQIAFIMDAFEMKPRGLFSGYQIHGDYIESIVTEKEGDAFPLGRMSPESDGTITNIKNITLMTKFADCMPLLFFDPIKKVQAGIHSGWKGTMLHIGPKALKKMVAQYGSNPRDIIVVIGPSIRKCHFEVEADVAIPFMEQFPHAGDKIVKVDSVKYHIDLQGLLREELLSEGIQAENILETGFCTHCEPWLHSYRRDKENFGLMAALSILI